MPITDKPAGTFKVTEAAKLLHVSDKTLRDTLRDNGLTYKKGMDVFPSDAMVDRGLMVPYKSRYARITFAFTETGLQWFKNMFPDCWHEHPVSYKAKKKENSVCDPEGLAVFDAAMLVLR